MAVHLNELEWQAIKAERQESAEKLAALTAEIADLRAALDYALTEWEMTVAEHGHVGRTPDFRHMRRDSGLDA